MVVLEVDVAPDEVERELLVEPVAEDPVLDPALEAPLVPVVELPPEEPTLDAALDPELPFVDDPPEVPAPWVVALDPVESPDDAPLFVEPPPLVAAPDQYVLFPGELHPPSNAARAREQFRTVIITAASLPPRDAETSPGELKHGCRSRQASTSL